MLPLISLLLHPWVSALLHSEKTKCKEELWSGSFFYESGDSESQCRLAHTQPAALARVDTFSGVFHSSIALYD